MPSDQHSIPIPEVIQAGVALHEAGRLAEAESVYLQVLAVEPDNPQALHLLGLIAHSAGKNEIAVRLIGRASAAVPSDPIYLNNLGEAYRALQRFEEALASFDQSLRLAPGYFTALNNRGIALQALGRFDEALASIDQALAVNPGLAWAWSNRGNILQGLGRCDEALASFDKALEIDPGFADAFINRASVLRQLGRYEASLEACDQALLLKPGSVDALTNRGNALQELGQHGEALVCYEKALAIDPGFAKAQYNESLCLLLLGNYEQGWQKYEFRWAGIAPATRDFSEPLWRGGEDIAGKTVLLHAEQGLGDTIQFARYARAVAERGAEVVLEVQPVLHPLMAGLAGPQAVLRQGNPLPRIDFHCPLLSLPLAMGTRLATIPAAIPYLTVKESTALAWRTKLAVDDARLVGLAWKGDPVYGRDFERSIRLAQLLPLLYCPGVRFVSLQKELDEEESAFTAGRDNFVHPGLDFADTAGMIGALDLVVSVDTAWAHWAGALGKPVWVLLALRPHWCWLLARRDSPWYPTARLFRQTRPGEWGDVIGEVAEDLRRLATR